MYNFFFSHLKHADTYRLIPLSKKQMQFLVVKQNEEI